MFIITLLVINIITLGFSFVFSHVDDTVDIVFKVSMFALGLANTFALMSLLDIKF